MVKVNALSEGADRERLVALAYARGEGDLSRYKVHILGGLDVKANLLLIRKNPKAVMDALAA